MDSWAASTCSGAIVALKVKFVSASKEASVERFTLDTRLLHY